MAKEKPEYINTRTFLCSLHFVFLYIGGDELFSYLRDIHIINMLELRQDKKFYMIQIEAEGIYQSWHGCLLRCLIPSGQDV